MNNKEKWQQLVELNQKIKKAQELYKTIASEMIPELGDESISVGEFTIYKSTKVTHKLNGTESEWDLCKKFPEHTKFNLTSFKKENPWMVDHITDKTTTTSLSIKKKKDAKLL